MNTHILSVVFGIYCLVGSAVTKQSAPVVQVYSRTKGVLGKANILLCHVNKFYPPVIKLDLLRNGVVINQANQTEMVFEADWDYFVTKHVPFSPKSGEKYTCLVTHMGISRTFVWEPDM
ncbi:beta-2-microglobulin-like [Vanacampus margaritifer]